MPRSLDSTGKILPTKRSPGVIYSASKSGESLPKPGRIPSIRAMPVNVN